MQTQSTASSLSPRASSKISISCTANSVNPKTKANATMWSFRFKIVQAEKVIVHSTSTLIRSRGRKGSGAAPRPIGFVKQGRSGLQTSDHYGGKCEFFTLGTPSES
jgi:hypothetical protein